MRETDWLIPAIVLTALAGGVALALIPQASGLLPALAILPAWMACAALMALVAGFVHAARMKLPSPSRAAVTWLRDNRRHALLVAGVMLLAGCNMVAFMWVKPLLNYLVPFTADPLLARWDAALFMGNDPFQLLGWLAFPAAGLVYHPVWFGTMIFALLLALAAKPSPQRSAVLLSYFVLWSLAGPFVHALLPAAGPIFYERMGYGPRFAALDGGVETRMVADYLWSIYAARDFGAGSGISAMPSMHVTISSWVVLVFALFARRWLWMALVAWAVIFGLSIALGWHYALDGLVGAALAAGVYAAALAGMRRVVARRSRGWFAGGLHPAT